MAPAMARLPVLKKTPMRGVIRVVPQVGQPAPSAMSPVMIPACSRLAAFCSRFFCQRKTVSPIRIPWSRAMKKVGSQSKNGWLMPKTAIKLSQMMRSPLGKPRRRINSNFDKPPESRFIKSPKNRKAGMNPYQKRFSFVASRIPLPAKTKSSSHFLQFMYKIVTYFFIFGCDFCVSIQNEYLLNTPIIIK